MELRDMVVPDVGSISEGNITAFCKLFSDMVTEHLCELRMRELNSSGGFSCEGCVCMLTLQGARAEMDYAEKYH